MLSCTRPSDYPSSTPAMRFALRSESCVHLCRPADQPTVRCLCLWMQFRQSIAHQATMRAVKGWTRSFHVYPYLCRTETMSLATQRLLLEERNDGYLGATQGRFSCCRQEGVRLLWNLRSDEDKDAGSKCMPATRHLAKSLRSDHENPQARPDEPLSRNAGDLALPSPSKQQEERMCLRSEELSPQVSLRSIIWEISTTSHLDKRSRTSDGSSGRPEMFSEFQSDPRRGETVDVLRLAPEDACANEMVAIVRWQKPQPGRPLISSDRG